MPPRRSQSHPPAKLKPASLGEGAREPLAAVQHRLEEVPFPLEPPQDDAHGEVARTDLLGQIVLPQPFWRKSTSTPERLRFSHSVVTVPGCSASSRRATSSAKAYVSS